MTTPELVYQNKPVTREIIYSLLLNYKGYGNPSGKYWFIGMEEHWKTEDQLNPLISCKQTDIDYYSRQIIPFELVKDNFYKDAQRRGNSFERGIIKFLQNLEGETKYKSILENYCFITNSRFAPFPTFKEIHQIFGKSKQEYLEDDSKYKFGISQLWLKTKPAKTFCLSQKYTEEFLLLFRKIIPEINLSEDLKSNTFVKEFNSENFSIYQILHPRRFSEEYLKNIIKKIK